MLRGCVEVLDIVGGQGLQGRFTAAEPDELIDAPVDEQHGCRLFEDPGNEDHIGDLIRQCSRRPADDVEDALHPSKGNQAVAVFDRLDQLAETHGHESFGKSLVREYSPSTGGGDAHGQFEPGFCR